MRQQDRNRELYEQMVQSHAAELYHFAHRYCGNEAVAEDLVSEAFTEAWRGIGSLRQPEKARAWLFRILRRRCSKWWRESRRQLRIAVPLEDVEPVLEAPGPDILDALATRDQLQTALGQLEDRFKVPFLMVFLEGLTCQETADALELPLGTVLSRIHRARKALRRALARQAEAGAGRPRPRLRTIGGNG